MADPPDFRAMDENPFASPTVVDAVDEAYEHVEVLVRPPMPAAVMWAIGYAIVAYVTWTIANVSFFSRAWSALEFIRFAAATACFLSVIYGAFRRSRLAYRFVRTIVAITGALAIVSVGGVAWLTVLRREAVGGTTVVFFFAAAATWWTWAMLARRETKAFFLLECPRCKKIRNRAANFLFTRAKCKQCRVTW